EAADEPLAAVIDRGEDLGAAGARPADLVADQRVPDRLTELGLDVGGAEAPEPRLRLDLDMTEAGHRLEQAPGRGALAKSRRALRVVVQRDPPVDPVRERHRRQAVGQELRRVAHRERPWELLDLVIEVHARRTPHDDLFRLVALKELDRALVHPAGRGGVAIPVMDDAAAVRGAADRDVVEPEPVEDGRDRANHVRGAQDVDTEVGNDLVRLGVALGCGQTPRALLGQGRQVLGERDLAEVLLVVVGHSQVSSLRRARSSCRRSARFTLPVVVTGKVSMNSISRGYSCAAKRVRTCAGSSRASRGVPATPSRSWTNASPASPRTGSGAPMAAASATAGWPCRQSSISPGPIR